MTKWFVTLLFLFSVNLYAASTQSSITTPDIKKTASPGTVALTFDDGPHPVYTRQILAILKKYNIKATFFVVGASAKKYPDIIREIHDQGHVIGDHSMTHAMLTKLSDAKLKTEISGASDIVNQITGVRPKCLRYPFGASDERVRSAIRAQGMIPAPMGFNSYDYKRPGVQKIIDRVLKHVYSRQVILMHDGDHDREQTVAALPLIIEGIKKKGLGFSTICD